MKKLKEFNCNGVFESMRTYGGKVFKLKEHLDRLFCSMKSAGFKAMPNRHRLTALIAERLEKDGFKESYIRIAVSQDSDAYAQVDIITKPLKKHPADCYRKGVSVRTAVTKKNYVNSISPKIKSANFLYGVCARIEAGDVFESILLEKRGYVAEGSISNIFMVKSKGIFTPASLGCLPGITRSITIKVARDMGYDVCQTALTRHEFYTADEVFLTNTTMEIMPVIEFDARAIGNGKPGNITKRLREAFKKEVKSG